MAALRISWPRRPCAARRPPLGAKAHGSDQVPESSVPCTSTPGIGRQQGRVPEDLAVLKPGAVAPVVLRDARTRGDRSRLVDEASGPGASTSSHSHRHPPRAMWTSLSGDASRRAYPAARSPSRSPDGSVAETRPIVGKYMPRPRVRSRSRPAASRAPSSRLRSRAPEPLGVGQPQRAPHDPPKSSHRSMSRCSRESLDVRELVTSRIRREVGYASPANGRLRPHPRWSNRTIGSARVEVAARARSTPAPGPTMETSAGVPCGLRTSPSRPVSVAHVEQP